MDLEEAKEFRERCTQCAAVSWGLTDEGRYYCTSCHNVTEKFDLSRRGDCCGVHSDLSHALTVADPAHRNCCRCGVCNGRERVSEIQLFGAVLPSLMNVEDPLHSASPILEKYLNVPCRWGPKPARPKHPECWPCSAPTWPNLVVSVCGNYTVFRSCKPKVMKNIKKKHSPCKVKWIKHSAKQLRSKEVLSTEAIPNTKIQAINRGLKRKKKLERGWDWYVCEGFQHILCQQAEALQALGVSPEVKSPVLHNLWRRYLQKSKLAYCRNPVYTSRRAAEVSEDDPSHSGWDSGPELLSDFSGPSVFDSGAESQPDVHTRKPLPTRRASQSDMSSVCSGSLDGVEYSLRKAKGVVKMSMPGTLALCALSLLWQREAVTLSELLRLVEEGHVPYVNAFQHFPEEMKLYGRDKGIFAVESWPTYEDIYKKMAEVAKFLDLPRFPDVTKDCYLHPDVLCMKYLMEVNLPDEMYNFTCQVVKMAGTGEVDFLTFDPIAEKKNTVKYDIQAVAVIVIVLKLLFLLDDNLEWSLSTVAEKHNEENKEDKPWFDFRKWYQVMKKSFDEKKQKWEEARAKCVWKSEKPLYRSSVDRPVAYKRRGMVVNLQKQFSTLVDSTPVVAKKSPSSFQFNWTGDADGTCFHGHSLQGALEKRGQSLTTRNALYWLSTQKFCKSYCKHVTTYEESNFSLSYQFILNLFSFLLRINAYFLHEEVSLIEKRLFKTKYSKAKRKSSRSRKVKK